MRIEDLAAYEIISRQKIHDLRSEGYLLRHKKSGARIALLSNEDENKVFYIGFKTPPADSTGVAHIPFWKARRNFRSKTLLLSL